MEFFKNIWDFICEHAMKVWAFIATGLVAILTVLSINIPSFLQDYTTTKPTTTISTIAPTTADTTAATTTEAAPWGVTFTLEELEELGCELHEDVDILSYNSYGTKKPYTINAYVLKDVLEALGAEMDRISSEATLLATASDGKSCTIPYALIISGESYLAVLEDGSASSMPRIFPAPSLTNPTNTEGVVVIEGTFVDNSLCNKSIASFTLHY